MKKEHQSPKLVHKNSDPSVMIENRNRKVEENEQNYDEKEA